MRANSPARATSAWLAALLLIAYLYPLRVLIRLGLGARANRLLKAVTARTANALHAQAEDACTAVRETVADHQATLERLCSIGARWRAELSEKGTLDGGR